MNPPRRPPAPGESDRDAVERLVEQADRETRALLRPHLTLRPSGVVLQVVNVGPDYECAHAVAIDSFATYSHAKTFCGLLPHHAVHDLVRYHLLAPIYAWRMN